MKTGELGLGTDLAADVALVPVDPTPVLIVDVTNRSSASITEAEAD
jgi:hypothetical protein